MTPPIERYVKFLETLSIKGLDVLSDYVTPNVRFRDPFNDVTGVENMRKVFIDMFEHVGPIEFTIIDSRGDFEVGVLVWKFKAQLLKKSWVFEGTTVLRFAADGRVSEHVDHWDAARNFYERLPMIGWLLRALRRQLAVEKQ